MAVDVYARFRFNSVVNVNSITTLNFWKGKDTCKICGIEINIEYEQT